MREEDLDQLLLERLEERNAKQSACFEELALLFTCQQDRCAHLEAQVNKGKNERNRAVVRQSSKVDHSEDGNGQDAPDDQQQVAEQGGTEEDSQASNSFPTSVFELRREILRLRAEADGMQAILSDLRSSLKGETSTRKRLEASVKEKEEVVKVLKNELQHLRKQHQSTEERYLEAVAKNHDLETRIVEEKIKMAETLNSMNELFKQGQSAQLTVSPPLSVVEQAEDEEDQSSDKAAMFQDHVTKRSWTSHVGVSIPKNWKVLSDVRGIKTTSICYNSDGTLLVSGGSDGVVQLWSPITHSKIVRGSVSIRQPVISVDMKGSFILATSDRVGYIWRKAEGESGELEQVHTLTGHTSTVVAGKITPDCRYASTAGRKVKVWDVATGDCLRTLDAFSKCLALDVNEHGTLLVTGHADKHVRLWDLRTAKRVGIASNVHKAPITSATFSFDGEKILTCAMDHSLAVLQTSALDQTTPKYLTHPHFLVNPWWCRTCLSPGFNAQGSLFAAAGSKDGSLHVWQVNTAASVYVQKAHPNPITCVVWSPLGNQLASCDANGGLILWSP